jgi:hypothetical protein
VGEAAFCHFFEDIPMFPISDGWRNSPMVNQVAKACRWSEIENLELRSICVGLECGHYAHQTSPILDYISADVAIFLRTSMRLHFQGALLMLVAFE